MSFENFTRTFEVLKVRLLVDWDVFGGNSATKQLVEGQSSVLHGDLFAEQQLVPHAHRFWPDLPILCEEAENSGLATLIPEATLLSCEDTVTNLPKSLISADGLDGSALYANKMFNLVTMMLGVINDGAPHAGMVSVLNENLLYHTGINGREGAFEGDEKLCVPFSKRPLKECLVGTDGNKAVDPLFHELVINKLMGCPMFRYPVNVPSGVGGLDVARSKLAAYITSNARLWDIAATAALCKALGMVVRSLDGSPIPWNRVRMPPVVFARDEETFECVQKLARAYLRARTVS